MKAIQLLSPRTLVLVVALLAGLSAGCDSPKNKVVPVEGKILFSDGKPLPPGTKLLFNPAEGGTGTAVGVVKENGLFEVGHVTGVHGAEIGKYTVVLRAPKGNEEAFYKFVPSQYTTDAAFAVEVAEGMPPLDLKVKRPRKK